MFEFQAIGIHSASVPGADVRASLDVPACPAVAAAHGLELLVGELEPRLLDETEQLLGARGVPQLLLELGVLEVLGVHLNLLCLCFTVLSIIRANNLSRPKQARTAAFFGGDDVLII